jgi:hypothetical protein
MLDKEKECLFCSHVGSHVYMSGSGGVAFREMQNSTLPTFSRSNTTGILEDPCARILKNSSRI